MVNLSQLNWGTKNLMMIYEAVIQIALRIHCHLVTKGVIKGINNYNIDETP